MATVRYQVVTKLGVSFETANDRGIQAAVSALAYLVRQIDPGLTVEVLEHTTRIMGQCNAAWGSHGCILSANHDGPHVCQCHLDHPPSTNCSEEFGCVGTTPYYGPDTKFYDAE
jgi:hypothetical protein